MKNVIIDTDPGSDDALALIMAFNSTDLNILGITTVGGNASIQDTTRNALSIIDYLGHKHIPIHPGEQYPYQGFFQNAYEVHGSHGLGIVLPEPKTAPSNPAAYQFISATAASEKNNLLIVALGPLTNIALALQTNCKLKRYISEIIVMGGAVKGPGNITPYAEFNIYNDPVSAEVVFNSGIPITLVGLDVTHKTSFTNQEAPWVYGNSKGSQLAKRILQSRFCSFKTDSSYQLHDPLAVIAAIHQGVLKYRNVTIEVEQKGTKKGRTNVVQEHGSIKLATDVYDKVAKKYIVELLGEI